MTAHFAGPQQTFESRSDIVQHQKIIEIVRFALPLSAQSIQRSFYAQVLHVEELLYGRCLSVETFRQTLAKCVQHARPQNQQQIQPIQTRH